VPRVALAEHHAVQQQSLSPLWFSAPATVHLVTHFDVFSILNRLRSHEFRIGLFELSPQDGDELLDDHRLNLKEVGSFALYSRKDADDVFDL
jgi:hypothetical protein